MSRRHVYSIRSVSLVDGMLRVDLDLGKNKIIPHVLWIPFRRAASLISEIKRCARDARDAAASAADAD